MNDAGSEVRDAVIREAVGLAALIIVVWYFGPGRLWLEGIRHRAVSLWKNRDNAVDMEVREFRGQVSRWEHEQAAQTNRRPAGDDPCGCS